MTPFSLSIYEVQKTSKESLTNALIQDLINGHNRKENEKSQKFSKKGNRCKRTIINTFGPYKRTLFVPYKCIP